MANITYTAKEGIYNGIGSEVGSWLNSDTAESVISSELVTNGDFASDVSNWTQGDAQSGLSWVSGVMRITNNDASQAWAYQGVTTVAGKKYTVSSEFISGTSTNFRLAVGTAAGSANLGYVDLSASGWGDVSFTATGITTYVWVMNASTTTTEYVDVDNISLRIADEDLSSNDHDLAYFGTITKSAVATGSEVMGYSGWSGSNYLYQSYDSVFNVGTGDFSLSLWVKPGASGAFKPIVCRFSSSQNDANAFNLKIGYTNYVYMYNTSATLSDTTILDSDTWYHVVFTRISGIGYFFINSTQSASGAWAPSITNTTYKLYVGVGGISLGSESGGAAKLGLLKFYNVSLTADQIKTIYDTEKNLFKKNSPYRLYGTEYSLDYNINAETYSEQDFRNEIRSIGGNSEYVYERTDNFHDLNIVNLQRADMPTLRNFMNSVADGSSFTYDPYGTEASPDEPITVTKDSSGHTESRIDTLDLFSVSLRVREQE